MANPPIDAEVAVVEDEGTAANSLVLQLMTDECSSGDDVRLRLALDIGGPIGVIERPAVEDETLGRPSEAIVKLDPGKVDNVDTDDMDVDFRADPNDIIEPASYAFIDDFFGDEWNETDI